MTLCAARPTSKAIPHSTTSRIQAGKKSGAALWASHVGSASSSMQCVLRHESGSCTISVSGGGGGGGGGTRSASCIISPTSGGGGGGGVPVIVATSSQQLLAHSGATAQQRTIRSNAPLRPVRGGDYAQQREQSKTTAAPSGTQSSFRVQQLHTQGWSKGACGPPPTKPGNKGGSIAAHSKPATNLVLPVFTTFLVALPNGDCGQQQQPPMSGCARRAHAVLGRRAGLLLPRLPVELLQSCLDLLPTFADRARVCSACTVTRDLEWRMASPLRPEEELSGIGLGDMGAKAVAKALMPGRGSAIRELCLGSNSIGDAGARELALALGSGCTLRRLSLRHNKITDEGAEALAMALASNSELEELDIWGNFLTHVGKLALLAAARCKVFLELDEPLRGQAHLTPGQAVVTGMMRAVLFDWLSEVHNSGSAPAALNGESDPQEMLFRTFSHVDTYLSQSTVQRSELQLTGVACTLAAAVVPGKEDAEESAELASWLAFVTDGACTVQEVRDRARDVHQALGFRLHQPTAYTFLRRYLRKTGWTEESFSLANYLIELAAIDPDFRIYRPQTIAAAAAVLSRQYLSQGITVQHVPGWKARLLRCARVDLQAELAPCAAAMARMHAMEHGHRSKFVNVKYEWARLHMVAKIAPNSPPDAASFVAYLLEDRAG